MTRQVEEVFDLPPPVWGIIFRRAMRGITMFLREAKMKYLILVLSVLFGAYGAVPALSHGGGTDSNGCHMNHKTGDYHCH
ncbi:YHYH domain-containing protein [Mesorhizobium sp. BHbsci]